MRLLYRRRRGFTLLELIVVIVILGLLAALAIPTFSRVIERSKDQTAAASLAAIAREAQALAAFGGAGFDASDIETAIGETASAYAQGLYAATSFTVSPDGTSSEYGVVAYEISPDGTTLGLTMQSSTSRCVYAVAEASSSASAVDAEKSESCAAGDATTVVASAGSGDLGTGGGDTGGSGTGAFGASASVEVPPIATRTEVLIIDVASSPAGTASVNLSCNASPYPAQASMGLVWYDDYTPATGSGSLYWEWGDADGNYLIDQGISLSAEDRTYTCTLTAYDASSGVLGSEVLTASVSATGTTPPPSGLPACPAPNNEYIYTSKSAYAYEFPEGLHTMVSGYNTWIVPEELQLDAQSADSDPNMQLAMLYANVELSAELATPHTLSFGNSSGGALLTRTTTYVPGQVNQGTNFDEPVFFPNLANAPTSSSTPADQSGVYFYISTGGSPASTVQNVEFSWQVLTPNPAYQVPGVDCEGTGSSF